MLYPSVAPAGPNIGMHIVALLPSVTVNELLLSIEKVTISALVYMSCYIAEMKILDQFMVENINNQEAYCWVVIFSQNLF